MPDPEQDAEDGEVREAPAQGSEEKRDEKRKFTEDPDRGSKRHKSDRDRSRSREKGKVDRDREKEREKRISYDQVSYAGDSYERYDRYAAATEARDLKFRKERGRDDRDDRSRRVEYEREYESRERDKRKDDFDKERERRRDRDEKELVLERRKDRDDDGDKRKEKERDRGKDPRLEKETKRPEEYGKERDKEYKKDERNRRSRSRERNKGKESDRRDDRHDRKKDRTHGRGKDGHGGGHTGDLKSPRGGHDEDGEGLLGGDDDEEAIRKRRAAILEKYKNKSVANGGPLAAKAAESVQTPDQQEDIFTESNKDAKVEDVKPEAEDVEDKDEIDTAQVFAAKERGESDDEEQDDMFTNSPLRGKNPSAKMPGRTKENGDDADGAGVEEGAVDRRLGDTNADNWDDAEGYFRTRPGELLIGRYLVNRDIGNGVYSTVLSATDQQSGNEVAIKVVRSNETMTVAGRKEIDILKKLGAEDPEGRRHICKLLSHFEYKNHLCMVFVPLEMNLRKLLKTYGREVGITLSAIRQYTRQLLIGLAHMVKCRVVHGDIKLDNIVITKDLKNVAICDFGTADWENECVITPYMVSRYYRPPEICLGLRYGYAMDLWSVGVCLFELYTGKFMFTGRNNNDMLKQFLDLKGAPNKRFLKKGQFFDQHFEEEKGQIVFKWLTQDKVTKAEIIEKKIYDKPVKTIFEMLRRVRAKTDDAKKIKEFSDLLEQIFTLDPTKRITVSEALKHPFLH